MKYSSSFWKRIFCAALCVSLAAGMAAVSYTHLDVYKRQAQISFLSGCTVLAMTIVSLLRSRGEKIELRRGTLLAVGAAVGGLLGKVVFDWVKSLTGSDGLVGVVQSVIMVLLTAGVGVYMLSLIHI